MLKYSINLVSVVPWLEKSVGLERLGTKQIHLVRLITTGVSKMSFTINLSPYNYVKPKIS